MVTHPDSKGTIILIDFKKKKKKKTQQQGYHQPMQTPMKGSGTPSEQISKTHFKTQQQKKMPIKH
jgi:hypothetical protein